MYQIFVVCADRFYNCIEYSRTMCVVYKCVDLMIYVSVPRNAIKLHLLHLLSFMEEKELMWPEKEVSDVGEVFVQSLVDLLWYIDNHHSTFNERSHKIPPIFDRFTGYNMPQVHKHQKRSAENLSSVLLTDYSNKLFRCLQSCY